MSAWPIGLSTGCFCQRSIFECLDALRKGGFKLVEVCSMPAHLDYHDPGLVTRAARELAARGIEAYSFHAPFADHIDISAKDPKLRKGALAELLRAAEAAARFPTRYFVLHPGPERRKLEGPGQCREGLKRVAESLAEVAKRCRALGLGCVLENKLPHLAFASTSDLLWLLRALGSVEVGICLDTGHAHLSGDLSGVLRALHQHLRMVHAHDNRGGGDEHLVPGAGTIDWHKLLGELAGSGFTGGLILELASTGDVDQLLTGAREAKRFLRGLIPIPDQSDGLRGFGPGSAG
jgi:sugar phosphate isomerase/epimerase